MYSETNLGSRDPLCTPVRDSLAFWSRSDVGVEALSFTKKFETYSSEHPLNEGGGADECRVCGRYVEVTDSFLRPQRSHSQAIDSCFRQSHVDAGACS